jgi:hypothetical protein
MLLAPALAAAQDGNLVEYGLGTFSGEELMMNLPRMKIFRDGRVLLIDEQSALQGHIDADRIEKLESDLAREPLLRATRYVEFSNREPIPHGGGLSYIRFRDGENEVIAITPGIALDRDWKAIIRRIEEVRPATTLPFRPEHVRFFVFEWPQLPGVKELEWPFADSMQLKETTGNDPVSISDPAMIAFVIDASINSKFPRPPVLASAGLFQFGVLAAPGWTDPPAFEKKIAEIWRAVPKHGRGSGVQDGNLIEYGMGGFGDGGHGPPMLFPPAVKIYADGRIVYGDNEGYWQGTIEQKRLERLRRDLARNDLLKQSQLLKVSNGGLISMHGGMAYIRYRDGDDEVVVAVLSHPHRGPYPRLLSRIREEIPGTYSRFRPKGITFRLYPGNTWVEPVDWPFTATIPLQGRSESISTTDPAAIAFVIDHGFGGFSWMQTNVRENGTNYEIILESVRDWYEQRFLGMTLDDLHLSAEP